ncbi:MAG: hypothetical protein GTO14_22750 [Anaerolineales bacterium]|nr:hypothetical protein [Anaerolineales bacterium]
MSHSREFDKPACFEIRLKGRIEHEQLDWFEGFSLEQDGDVSVMTGIIADQTALHGLITKIRQSGFPILSLKKIES